jgi:hypothetical protein
MVQAQAEAPAKEGEQAPVPAFAVWTGRGGAALARKRAVALQGN